MLKGNMQQALNDQLNAEMYSAYLYPLYGGLFQVHRPQRIHNVDEGLDTAGTLPFDEIFFLLGNSVFEQFINTRAAGQTISFLN